MRHGARRGKDGAALAAQAAMSMRGWMPVWVREARFLRPMSSVFVPSGALPPSGIISGWHTWRMGGAALSEHHGSRSFSTSLPAATGQRTSPWWCIYSRLQKSEVEYHSVRHAAPKIRQSYWCLCMLGDVIHVAKITRFLIFHCGDMEPLRAAEVLLFSATEPEPRLFKTSRQPDSKSFLLPISDLSSMLLHGGLPSSSEQYFVRYSSDIGRTEV